MPYYYAYSSSDSDSERSVHMDPITHERIVCRDRRPKRTVSRWVTTTYGESSADEDAKPKPKSTGKEQRMLCGILKISRGGGEAKEPASPPNQGAGRGAICRNIHFEDRCCEACCRPSLTCGRCGVKAMFNRARHCVVCDARLKCEKCPGKKG